MLDTSDECLVMEYEPSQSIIGDERNKIDKHVLLRFLQGVLNLTAISVLHGFIHADLHMGNYGIRNPETTESMRIVLYDFGNMYDVRSLSSETRTNIIIYNDMYDLINLARVGTDDTYHRERFLHMMSEHIELGNKLKHKFAMKKLVSYMAINGVKMIKQKFQIFVFMEKTVSAMNIVDEIETDPEYKYMYNDIRKYINAHFYDKYYPYDDMKILYEKLGHLRIR